MTLTPDGTFASLPHFPAASRRFIKPERSPPAHCGLLLRESASAALVAKVCRRRRPMRLARGRPRTPGSADLPYSAVKKGSKNIVNSTGDLPWQFCAARAKSCCHRRKTHRCDPIPICSLNLQSNQSARRNCRTRRKMAKSGNITRAFQHPYTTVNCPLSAVPTGLRPSPDEISLDEGGNMLVSRTAWIWTKECAVTHPD